MVLLMTNPNREPLTLEGVSCSIHLVGNKLMSGAANDLPTIELYGEAYVKLNATVNLPGSFQLITGLINEDKEPIESEFNARLDVGSFKPRIEVSKKGML